MCGFSSDRTKTVKLHRVHLSLVVAFRFGSCVRENILEVEFREMLFASQNSEIAFRKLRILMCISKNCLVELECQRHIPDVTFWKFELGSSSEKVAVMC